MILMDEHTRTHTQAVAFDVDSTVCAEEGIDVLADFLGQGEAVAELTAKCVRVN